MKIRSADALQDSLRTTLKEIRGIFDETNVPQVWVEVEASGQTLSGDLMIEFVLRDGRYGEAVRGGTLQATLDEFLRRRGWRTENAPICLPRVDQDDIVAKADSIEGNA